MASCEPAQIRRSSNAACSVIRAFLRREHVRQRRPVPVRGLVTSHARYDRDVSHVVGNLGVVDAGQAGGVRRRQAATSQSVRIEETMAERSGQASAAVGGGAAAQSKYDAIPLRRRSRRESARRCRKWTPPTDRGRRGRCARCRSPQPTRPPRCGGFSPS